LEHFANTLTVDVSTVANDEWITYFFFLEFGDVQMGVS